MNDGEIMKPLPLDHLLAAAWQDDWDTVDAALADDNNTAYQAWAINGGLDNNDPNLRNLVASILEKTGQELDPEVIEKLTTLMTTDEGQYVRFRATFALVRHHRQSRWCLTNI